MRGRWRTRFVAGWAVAGLLAGFADPVGAQVRVRAPFVDVQEDARGVRVRAPFVDVDTDAARTRVRAPFTRVHTNRQNPSHHGAAVLSGLPMVRVEFEGAAPAAHPTLRGEPSRTPVAPQSVPEPRPMPASRRESETQPPRTSREHKPEQAPDAVAAAARAAADQVRPAYSHYLVVPVAPGAPRPAVRVQVEPAGLDAEPGPRPLYRARPDDGIRPEPAAAERAPSALTPGESEAQVIRLQPTWLTEVPRFFQPTAGVHIFALVHPLTRQTVAVRLDLPQGQPRIRVGSDELEFDYGQLEVEVRFRQDGRVVIRTNR